MSTRSVLSLVFLYVTTILAMATLAIGLYQIWTQVSTLWRVVMMILGPIAFLGLIIVAVHDLRRSRRVRYADTLSHIHRTYLECVEGASKPLGDDPKLAELELLRRGQAVCNSLAAAFGTITGRECAVCIKLIEQSPEDLRKHQPRLSVATVCRDSVSVHRSHGKREDVVHWLDGNTDFKSIHQDIGKPEGGYFFENDLPTRHGYVNTSYEIYGYPKEHRILLFQNYLRRKNWPLPYRSTIVAPILPSNNPTATKFVGYLCVDSKASHVFRQPEDQELLRSAAIAVYPLVHQWAQTIERKGVIDA